MTTPRICNKKELNSAAGNLQKVGDHILIDYFTIFFNELRTIVMSILTYVQQ